jgi:hypothetical protein
MKHCHYLLLIASLAAAGCASAPQRTATKADDAFLLERLDDAAKSKALTDQGIEEYRIHLEKQEDFSTVTAIREYFATALRFDPENVMAKQYLNLVDNFKSTRLKQKLQEANSYFAKTKRKEEEDYAMCLAILAAARLDPANATVTKLMRDTSQTRATLVSSYLGKAKASMAKITTTTTQAAKDALVIDAYQNAAKAAAVDPQNGAARDQAAQLLKDLSVIAARRIDNAEKLISAGKFDDARSESLFVYDLSRKADGAFAADLRTLNYSLYFKWAKSLYAKKDYAGADSKVNTALSVSKTDEAQALKKNITDVIAAQKKKATEDAQAQAQKASEAAAQAEEETTFASSVQEIDGLISQGDLVTAWDKIDVTSQSTADQAKQSQLDARKAKISSQLKGLYDKAIAAYREEDFKSAIEYLQTIVQINVDYEQAADYLDKAKAKQKLVDSY